MKQTTSQKSLNEGTNRSTEPFFSLTKTAAAASVAGLVFAASPAHLAFGADSPFVQKFGPENPLKAPIGLGDYQWARPACVDIDGDGDLDIFIGGPYSWRNNNGYILYFENTGDASNPVFTKRTGTANPFYGLEIAKYSAPTFADLDGDGDLDALVGGEGYGYGYADVTGSGFLSYFINTGDASNPVFTPAPTTTDNPFYGDYPLDYLPTPTFADIDGDGDMDVVVGGKGQGWYGSGYGYGYGSLHYFENVGTPTLPAFNYYSPENSSNPFYNLMVGDWMDGNKYSTPAAFADIDGDGDLDLFAGENYYGSGITLLENVSGGEGVPALAEAPAFIELDRDDSANPFYYADVDYMPAPTFADLDGDGDLDAIVGNGKGDLTFFENTGTNSAPSFVRFYEEDDSPFAGFDVGRHSRPVFVDIDGDGDMDMVSGGEYRYDERDAMPDGGDSRYRLNFFENTGTATAPLFVERFGTDSPLDSVELGGYIYDFADFVDIDNDGDMDLFVGGEEQNRIDFYQNVGTATDPVFEYRPVVSAAGLPEVTGNIENPLWFVNSNKNSAIKFVDIDGDGDMDAFVAGYDDYYLTGRIDFYENISTDTEVEFRQTNSPLVPDPGEYSNVYSLAFVDVDGDGDMDAIVGESSYDGDWHGHLRLYENTGTATAPQFTPSVASDLFPGLADQQEDYYNLTPAFVDIDGDGDLDVFMGEYYGRFLFFENQTPPPVVDDDDDDAPVVPGVRLPDTDLDGPGDCFINTTGGSQNSIFSRAATWIHNAITAMLK